MRTYPRWDVPVVIASMIPLGCIFLSVAFRLQAALPDLLPVDLTICAALLAALVIVFGLIIALRSLRYWLRRREDADAVAEAVDSYVMALLGFPGAALVGALPVLLLLAVLGALWLPDGVATPVAFVCGMATGGLWAGWRTGRRGALIAGVAASGLSAFLLLTWLPPSGRRVLLCGAGVLAAAIAGRLGRRLLAARSSGAARKAADSSPAYGAELVQTAGFVAALAAFIWVLAFTDACYGVARDWVLRGRCSSPVDMCATEDGRVFVLSSAARTSFFKHPAEVHVFDPTGRPLQCIVLADEDERFDQIAVTSGGRILLFGGFREISFLNEDGTLTRSPWSGAHDLRDMLWAGESLYILTDDLLSGSTEEGAITCRRRLPSLAAVSNLAAADERGCALVVDETLVTVEGREESTLRLATEPLSRPRLWLTASGPVVAAARLDTIPGPVRLRAFDEDGQPRAEHRLWVSSACLAPFGPARPVATARTGGRMLTLNLEPLKVREFDADLTEGPGFYVCGSRWEALLLRLHDTLEAAFGPGGVLVLAARVYTGLSDLTMVGLLLFAGVLLYGEFRLLRRLFRDEFGRTPQWVWVVVLLFPWAGTYALVWKWAQMLMAPAEREEPGAAAADAP